MRYGDEEWKALALKDRPSFYSLAKDELTEPSPWESDEGELIGRDPRKVPREVLERYYDGAGAGNGKIVHAKCLDCCCSQEQEIRKCTALACVLWPYRMGTNPFRNKPELTEEQRGAQIERGRAIARLRREKVSP
jgi:hypothetical protein